MPRMSRKAEANEVARRGQAKAPKTNCPVLHCRRNLCLVTHPTQPGRLVAFCNCSKREGLAVYETDAIQNLADQEENNGST